MICKLCGGQFNNEPRKPGCLRHVDVCGRCVDEINRRLADLPRCSGCGNVISDAPKGVTTALCETCRAPAREEVRA